MANLGTVIDRVNRSEKALEQQLQEAEQYVDSEGKEQLTQQVKSERSKKLKKIVDAFRSEVDTVPRIPELEKATLKKATTLENFEKSLEKLKEEFKAIEGSVSLEQKKALSRVGLEVLISNIEFVEKSLSREVASHITIQSQKKQFQKKLRELRNEVERKWRLTVLSVPENEQEFEAAIKWTAEQGEDIELATLQSLRHCLPFNSNKLQQLLDYAEKQIADRLRTKAKTYKIFCSPQELEQQFQGVQVIESKSDFTVISALSKTIADIKLLFRVEQFEPLEEPQPSRELFMDANRDQVAQFNTPSPNFEDAQGGDITKDADVTETYAIALIKDHESDQAFHLNQSYQLQAGIRRELFRRFKNESVPVLNREEPVHLDIVVWAEGMEIEPDWVQSYLVSRTEATPLAKFMLKPIRLGDKKIRVDFLYQRHWLAKVELDVEVTESPASVPVS